MRAAGLSFEQGIPRRLVHKQAIEEVLITDYRRLGEDSYAFAAQLPLNHAYFSDVCVPYHDVLSLGEALRQSAIVMGHEFLGIPSETQFIFRKIGTSKGNAVHREALRIGGRPAEVLLHATMLNMRERRGRVVSYVTEGVAFANGLPLGTGYGHAALMPKDTYSAVRKQMLEDAGIGELLPPVVAPLSPHEVGRRDERNVVIGDVTGPDADDTYSAGLVIRLDHRVFFDHPQDHVPGNLLLESIRQMAICAAARRHGLLADALVLDHLEVEFSGFMEINLPSQVAARPGRWQDGQSSVQLEVIQSGNVCGTADVTVAQIR